MAKGSKSAAKTKVPKPAGRVTIGIDLSDRASAFCVLDA